MGSPDDLKDGVRDDANAEPSLEDAFVTLVERDDAASAQAAGAGRAA